MKQSSANQGEFKQVKDPCGSDVTGDTTGERALRNTVPTGTTGPGAKKDPLASDLQGKV